MFWLLVPLVGGLIAAAVSSESDAAEKAAAEARREATEAKIRAKKAENNKRKQRVEAESDEQLSDLFLAHSAVIERQNLDPSGLSFETLKAFAVKDVPANPGALVKHLEGVAPGTVFSSAWLEQQRKAKILQDEIAAFEKIKQNLLG